MIGMADFESVSVSSIILKKAGFVGFAGLLNLLAQEGEGFVDFTEILILILGCVLNILFVFLQGMVGPEDSALSYLPLSHMYERISQVSMHVSE